MAAPLIDFGFIEYGGFTFSVKYKVMKHIRYRMAPGIDAMVEMSVPHTMTQTELLEVIKNILPNLRKMAERQRERESKAVERPSPQAYSEWRLYLNQLIGMVENDMELNALQYTVRFMRTRWGSCSPTRKAISINSALASLPRECTHYVLVHELSHIVHADHSPEFWRHVERYYPDYRRVRAFLKERPII